LVNHQFLLKRNPEPSGFGAFGHDASKPKGPGLRRLAAPFFLGAPKMVAQKDQKGAIVWYSTSIDQIFG